jgi:hypothetical protein
MDRSVPHGLVRRYDTAGFGCVVRISLHTYPLSADWPDWPSDPAYDSIPLMYEFVTRCLTFRSLSRSIASDFSRYRTRNDRFCTYNGSMNVYKDALLESQSPIGEGNLSNLVALGSNLHLKLTIRLLGVEQPNELAGVNNLIPNCDRHLWNPTPR